MTEALMCVLGEYKTGQVWHPSPAQAFGRGVAVAVPMGTRTAEGLCAHTHQRKAAWELELNKAFSCRDSSSSLRTGQATSKITFIIDQCMGSTACREHGRVQGKTSICSQFGSISCLTAAPRNCYYLHRHTWIGIELGEVFLSHQHWME